MYLNFDFLFLFAELQQHQNITTSQPTGLETVQRQTSLISF
jgi:hypothetical protein